MKQQTIAKVYAKSILELGDEKNIKIAEEMIKLLNVAGR